jgi:hypothetical protein
MAAYRSIVAGSPTLQGVNFQIAANSNLAMIWIFLPSLAMRQKREHCTSGSGHFALKALISEPLYGLTDWRAKQLGNRL